ncbi:GNAT family N-acetyltransferase [Ferroacidibacillus organovorans]|uniref:N-acetyltransferase domain-containing protein n=1 Tax=Ferroacidibacillus organovorans TaxID=1765683 RepID=A0A853KCP1_9BACL|nr:GNAT family protein [Ferroacidibacillus organovorans]KYP79939.1 hypothetical protein AYJ22_03310 [Ferroacidibacillus organovorans]OAG94583.1 hypothetical protein AYW79_04305 [Ferroacidibacillus organovorans]
MLHNVRMTVAEIVLRSIEQRDLSVLFQRFFADEYATWRDLDGAKDPIGEITFDGYMERMQSHLDSQSFERWLLIEIGETITGMVLYDWESRLTQTIEVGIAIFEPEMWNKGYGTNALALWINFIFRQLSPMTICLTTKSANHRMIRCAQKLGLEKDGAPCPHHINGEERVRMTISFDDWIKTSWSGISSTKNIDKSCLDRSHGLIWKA